MPHSPTFDEFAALARAHTTVPVFRRLTADTVVPVSAFCEIRECNRAFPFESVVGRERVGRCSFLGAGPFLTFEARGKNTCNAACYGSHGLSEYAGLRERVAH